MNYQFASIAIKPNLEETFDNSLDSVEFVCEERKKVQAVVFTIKKYEYGYRLIKKLFVQK